MGHCCVDCNMGHSDVASFFEFGKWSRLPCPSKSGACFSSSEADEISLRGDTVSIKFASFS